MGTAPMDEITMFASLRPDPPDEDELSTMRAAARRRVTTAARPRHTRRWLATGLTAAVAGAAAAAAVLASGGTPTPAPAQHHSTVVTAAWTVKVNPDGTVTVDIRQLADPARLQRVLRDDGINAFVLPIHLAYNKVGKTTYIHPTCTYPSAAPNDAPQSVQRAVVTSELAQGWIIHPSAMPTGSALFLTGAAMHGGGVVAGYPQVLTNDKLPSCKPFHLPAKK
jgi:hypothetical protein